MSQYFTKKELWAMPSSRLCLIFSYDVWQNAKQFYNPRLSQKTIKARLKELRNIIIILCERAASPIPTEEEIFQIIAGNGVNFFKDEETNASEN